MYQVRRRLKDYEDVADVELTWRAIQFKVVSDVRKELAKWMETADTLADQNQIQKAHQILDQFEQTKFTADVLKDFHDTFQLVEQQCSQDPNA